MELLKSLPATITSVKMTWKIYSVSFVIPFAKTFLLTDMNRSELLDTYIETIIDGMDHKTMYQYVYDMLEQNFETYSEEELVTEVKEYYPHILED